MSFGASLARALGLALAIVALCSEPARVEPITEAASAVVAANNRLGLELYQRIASIPGNITISPHSIATAMAMALFGARAENEKQMAAVLHLGLPTDAFVGAHRKLNDLLNRTSADNGPQLRVTSALHLTQNGDLITTAFRQFTADQFDAGIFEGSSLEAINAWVKERTNGRIEKILTRLDPNSVCVLLNAIYFKGDWSAPFDPRRTLPSPFQLASGESIQVPTMRQQDAYQFLKTQDYQAIRLPYRNSGIAMSLIVPIGAGGIGMMDRALDVQAPNILSALVRAPRTTVDLSLPLFKTEFRVDLVPLFQALGMTLAFDRDRADFSGMTGRIEESKRLHISQAEHRAFIDVNEAGTEAAASTAVEIAKRARPAQVLKIDRPFLYLIADEASGAILFVGRVMDPRAPAAQR